MNLQKNLPHVIPSHPLPLKLHACKIKEVVDLSGKLTKQESKLLAKGTGYIPKSTKTGKKYLLEDGNEWGWPINNDNVDICLTRCCNKDFNTMSLLKKRNDIVIKKADKGNAFVALTIPQYEAMANIQLEKNAYDKNPKMESILENQNRIKNYIIDIEKHNPVFFKKYKKYFQIDGEREKHIYFLPKIHKKMVDSAQGKIYPGRPITDAVKTFGSKLDKLFSKLIQPIRNNIKCTIQGSLECLLRLEKFARDHNVNEQNEHIPNLCFLTFDVEDLYTNVPIKDAMNIIKIELCKRKIVTGSTLFCLIEAVKLLFANNAIYFGNKLILQKDGFGMGFHSSPSIADIYVYYTVEKKIFECKDTIQPLFYGRLLDDGLTIFSNEQDALAFLSKMKTLNSSLTFTHEISKEHAIFLDFYLKYQNGLLIRSVYTKETSNMTIIHYKSDHPLNMKKSTIKGRFQWYLRTCNEASALFSVTISFIEALRKYQGYPVTLLYKLLLETIYEYEKRTWPYVKNPSFRIRSYLSDLNIPVQAPVLKPDHKRWKAVTFNSCSFKFVKPRVSQNVFFKPAWKVGKNLVKNLTSSNHVPKDRLTVTINPTNPERNKTKGIHKLGNSSQRTLNSFYPKR